MDVAGWFQELRRRRVIRALLGWGLLSFAILQVIEPLQHALGLGEWFLKAVVAVLAVGFPVTAGLAWAFDLTRRGIERTAPTEADRPAAQGGARAAPAVAIGLVGALIGTVVAGLAGWHLWGRVPEPGPDGRITVAVADFVNETKDPELDGLSEVLVGWLEQSRSLRVLTRGRLAALVRERGKQPDRIDEELARQVGGRAGVEVLLLGSIRRLGESYAVELRAVEPAGDHYLFAIPERVGAKEELFAVLERLSERVRERLRERPKAIQASKVKVDPLTRSFEAWQHYRRGMAKADRWDYGGAIQDFQRAIAVDPDFALAHLRIAEHGEWVGRPVEERRLAMEAAVRNIGSVPVKERLLVQAWRAHHEGREEEAERLHARALEAFPQDLEVLTQAMDLYLSASRWEEALPILRALYALDRGAAHVRWMLWECLGALDLGAERLALARAWADESPGDLPRLVEALGDAGQLEEAIAVARRATDLDDRGATRFAWAQALLRAGRYQEAEGALRPLVDPARTGGPSMGGIMQLAAALDYQGRRREAMAAVASIPVPVERDYHRLMHAFCLSCRLAPGEARRLAQAVFATGFHANEWLPLHLLMHGEDQEAAELAPRFASGGQGMRQYRALLAWRSGDRERAVVELEALARRGPSYSRPSAVYLLAAFAHEERRDRDLVTLVGTLGRAIPTGWHAVAYPEAALWAAQAHERLGQRDQAKARIERLLVAWARADPDLPLLAEAKAMRRRLESQASPGGKP